MVGESTAGWGVTRGVGGGCARGRRGGGDKKVGGDSDEMGTVSKTNWNIILIISPQTLTILSRKLL